MTSIDHVLAVLRGLTALDTAAPPGGPLPPLGGSSAAVASGGGTMSGATEELTPLGVLLAQLPVDPRIGKMMLYVRVQHVKSVVF